MHFCGFYEENHVCVFLKHWIDDLAEPAMAPSRLIHTLGVTTLHHTIGKGLGRVKHTARRQIFVKLIINTFSFC